MNTFAVRAHSKFQFYRAVQSATFILKQFSLHRINIRESLSINCFVNFYVWVNHSRVQRTKFFLHFILNILK